MTRILGVILLVVATGSFLQIVRAEIIDPPRDIVAWKSLHFTAEELSDGTSGDHRALKHDGIPNLMRYALGYGPREPIPELIAIWADNDQLEVIHLETERLPDVLCTFETSTDLVAWEIPALNEAEPDRQVRSFDFSTSVSRFFRLRVERTVVDSDNDELADDAELAWFGSIDHGPNDDPDGDGQSTGEELRMGRSPHRGVMPDSEKAIQATGLEVFTPFD